MLSKIFSNKDSRSSIDWQTLETMQQLEAFEEASKQKPVMVFKHSTRCGISAMALSRFERDFQGDASFKAYYLDLIAHRELSNEIASRYGVMHQSPQTVLLVDGGAVHTASHNGIDFEEINEIAAKHH